jgi:hypothetical protein
MGERVPEQPFGVAGPTPPPQNRAGMNGPSQPQATASKSNAACLVPDPLIGAKAIAIADSTQSQQSSTGGSWQAKDPQAGNLTSGVGGTGVVLQTPVAVPTAPVPIQPVPPPTQALPPPIQPVPPPTTSSSGLPGPANGTQASAPTAVPVVSAAAVPTVVATPATAVQPVSQAAFTESDPLETALKSHGVIWHDQKNLADGVHLTCRVANPQDANFTRVYEATGADFAAAVQAVLDQIDQQR